MVNAPSSSYVGGMLGESIGDTIDKFYNLGFFTNPNSQILSGFTNVGGIIGFVGNLLTTTITRSGVESGTIMVGGNAGGGVVVLFYFILF